MKIFCEEPLSLFVIVIVSVEVVAASVIPEPASNVRVSSLLSATTVAPPLTATFLKIFCDEP